MDWLDGISADEVEPLVDHSSPLTGRRSVKADASLMTTIGLVEGEILLALEERQIVPLASLLEQIGCPNSTVFMALGALVRAGLVRAGRNSGDLLVESNELTWPRSSQEQGDSSWRGVCDPAAAQAGQW